MKFFSKIAKSMVISIHIKRFNCASHIVAYFSTNSLLLGQINLSRGAALSGSSVNTSSLRSPPPNETVRVFET